MKKETISLALIILSLISMLGYIIWLTIIVIYTWNIPLTRWQHLEIIFEPIKFFVLPSIIFLVSSFSVEKYWKDK